MAVEWAMRIAAIFGFLAVACAPLNDQRGFAEQMARLEEAGVAHRDCVASTWYSDQHGETPVERTQSTPIELALHTPEANAECRASLRLLEESATENGLFRTYRCEFQGQQVEVSFSVARNDRDPHLFTWCEYALSGDEPFKDDEVYTRIRER